MKNEIHIQELEIIAIESLFGAFKQQPDDDSWEVVFENVNGTMDILYMNKYGSYIRKRGTEYGDDCAFAILMYLRKHGLNWQNKEAA